MSDQSSSSNQLPPIRGNPIPNAPINHDSSSGRPGPIVNLPIPKNRNGKPDYTQSPGLDLRGLAPKGGLNTDAPPTEGILGKPPFTIQKKWRNTEGEVVGEKEGEGEEGADDEDFEIIDHPTITPPPEENSTEEKPTEEEPAEGEPTDDASTAAEEEPFATTSILSKKVPPELVSDILEHAEYFAHAVLAKRDDHVSIKDNDRIYLTAKIPDFEAMEKDTAGKGGKEGAGGRPGRVRKMAFKLSSRDQGWSSWPDKGTYKGSHTWVDVELWRRNEGEVEAKGEKKEKKTEGEDEDEDEQTKLERLNRGKHLVGTWLLQRNIHAVPDPTEHEIVWDWKKDELDDEDDEKWEPGTLNDDGKRERWQKGGRIENGKFIRELKGGDEIRVVLKARYPGWMCKVESCEVECWWAV
ncbi:hypothetical protein ABW20_dc0105907 [Dactylellina cionopaga]|nr:hypothetical protein ABW20_dc0105907 [Dactylellina cionopaga]